MRIVPDAGPSDEPTSNQVERALNLSGLDRLAAALVGAGVGPDEANAAAGAAARILGGAGGELQTILVLQTGPRGAILQQLRASLPDGTGVVLARQSDGSFAATGLAADLTREIRNLRGEIDSESFYTSAVSAGLVDTLIPEFINAFAYDFNLASEVSRGAVFEVAYDQEVNGRGEPVGAPQLLYAELTTPQKSLALYRFAPPGGEPGWFDGNGATTKRGLMRTPIDGARITSKFGMRFHPTLHYTRMHQGVDFGAPIGTPIYAAADGVVASATPTGCGGNMVVIQHDKGFMTRYFHASRYAPGLHAGQQVTQGETVSYVGVTGTCTTGPHLHYETLINGEHVDPLSIPVEDAKRARLEGATMQAFIKERDRIDQARARSTS